MKTSRLLLALPVLGAGLAVPACYTAREPVGWVPATLLRADDCVQLERMLKLDALLKMNLSIDASIEGLHRSSDFNFGGTMEEDMATGAGGAAPSPGVGASGPTHSDTNVQVEGVDEADIVKTDGYYLYVLHGHELAIVDSWPVAELSLQSTTPIEGLPIEMFVAEGKVVVYSLVDGTAIFQAAGEPPVSSPYYYDYYGYGSQTYYPTLTKLTVLSLVGTETTVESELYVEGTYTSARRIGTQVRTVVSGGAHDLPISLYPSTYSSDDDETEQAYEDLRSSNTELIQSATLRDFTARRFVRQGAQLVSLEPSCSDHFVPTPGSSVAGLTQIISLDLAAPGQGVEETQVFGAAQTVYSSEDTLVLAGQSWSDPWWSRAWEGELDAPVSLHGTNLHAFDIVTDPARPTYVGTGSVPGWIHNQFSIDQHDGRLRVATTDSVAHEDGSSALETGVFVLDPGGPTLEILGSVTGLAPGEEIQAARFVDDRAYVVTFRQVDPLFVIDVGNPTAPTLLGQLHIPGFSEYIHPMPDGNHLLTIGRDGTAWGSGDGPAIQIFDVGNPLVPVLEHKYVLPAGQSEAEEQHKAFTFYQGYLAIPFTGWSDSWSSTLELFSIDVTTGIEHLASIDHSAWFEGLEQTYYDSCWGWGYYGVGVRRGVFIDDNIYSISPGGILVNPLSAPDAPIASVALPEMASTDCVWIDGQTPVQGG